MPLVTDADYSDEIAALPKHVGYSTLPPRSDEQHVTLHYSGVAYPKTDRNGQLQRILDEAYYQLHHNYGSSSKPAYPDGLLYDVVILDDGWRVLTRARRQQLWHCGNATGNKRSWAVHLMLGPNQDATESQWAATINIIEQLCSLYNIPRTNVVGHNEWPRHDGAPQPSSAYRLLPEQSECPGKLLHARLAAWRATSTDPLKARTLPGVPGKPAVYCSAGAWTFYGQRGGVKMCGYPLQNEFLARSQNGQDCSVLCCERVIIKSSNGYGIEQALLSEARALGWLL